MRLGHRRCTATGSGYPRACRGSAPGSRKGGRVSDRQALNAPSGLPRRQWPATPIEKTHPAGVVQEMPVVRRLARRARRRTLEDGPCGRCRCKHPVLFGPRAAASTIGEGRRLSQVDVTARRGKTDLARISRIRPSSGNDTAGLVPLNHKHLIAALFRHSGRSASRESARRQSGMTIGSTFHDSANSATCRFVLQLRKPGRSPSAPCLTVVLCSRAGRSSARCRNRADPACRAPGAVVDRNCSRGRLCTGRSLAGLVDMAADAVPKISAAASTSPGLDPADLRHPGRRVLGDDGSQCSKPLVCRPM